MDTEIYYRKPSGGKLNISWRRVQILCTEGLIPGVFKLGDVWVIPKDSDKPNDNRTREARQNIGKDKICHH